MKVVDLTRGYITHVIDEDNFFTYESLYPKLFEHYYRFWSPRKPHESVHKEAEILKKRDLVVGTLKKIYPIMKKFEPRIGAMKAVLFVGDGTTNGHAFYDDDTVVVWLPVECYDKQLDAEIFITHEIVHGLHYLKQPDFYFMDDATKNHCGRQVITEGLASLASAELLKQDDAVALWGEYLSQKERERWMTSCEQLESDLFTYTLERFDDCLTDGELFVLTDKSGLITSRAGYYVGLKLMRKYMTERKLSLDELLSVPFIKMRGDVRGMLTELSAVN